MIASFFGVLYSLYYNVIVIIHIFAHSIEGGAEQNNPLVFFAFDYSLRLKKKQEKGVILFSKIKL